MKYTTTEDDAIFTDWMLSLGMNTPQKLFAHLCRAWKEGRVLVLDHATQQALVSASMERTAQVARRAARQEARDVLFEMGFTPNS